MKHLLIFWILGAVGLSTAKGRSLAIDGFAAMVNGRIITAGDVMEATHSARQQLRQRYQGRELVEAQAKLFDDGLERLIENRLILEAFEAMGGQLPEGAVRERTESILRERFNNNRRELLDTLRRVGKTEREWENELREQIIVQQMTASHVTRRINITPRMIREAYEERKDEFTAPVEMHLRAISLRPVREEDLPDRLTFLEELHAELAAGRDFADTAREVSQTPQAAQGGDLGWVRVSTLPQPIRDALLPLAPGALSDPVITSTQHHIFLVKDRRGGGAQPIGEVQNRLERDLREKEYDRLYSAWIASLEQQFPVIRFGPGQQVIQRSR